MPHPIFLHNTMSRSVEQLRPLSDNRVSVYTCGLTVYGYAHIGNLRAYIAEDVLVKVLAYFGYEVDRVMNITDVGHLTSDEDEGEDKMEVGARREGMTAWQVAKRYEEAFLKDFEATNIQIPAKLIRATDTIAQQIEFIKGLEEKGYVYKIEDGMYFDSSKVSDYGKLARLDLEGLQAGARVAMAEGKHRVTDFALWKFSRPAGKRDMEWESPWGVGFPGWHIECSAIILDQLGPEIDIHCGGSDHIPVHHVNEIAQSESLTGKTLAREWFHVGFLQVDNVKLSKSLGNSYTLADLRERSIEPLAFRMFTYSALYRSKLNFTWEALETAQKSLDRLRGLVAALPDAAAQPDEGLAGYVAKAEEALASDLNMPEFIAVVWEVLRSDLEGSQKKLFIERFDSVLSLGLTEKREVAEVPIPENVRELARLRTQARSSSQWEEADRLREKIEEAGFVVIDQPGVAEAILRPR